MIVGNVDNKMYLNEYCVYMFIIVNGYEIWIKLLVDYFYKYIFRVVKYIYIKFLGGIE